MMHEEPTLAYVPGAHGVHIPEIGPEYEPDWQVEHVVDCAGA